MYIMCPSRLVTAATDSAHLFVWLGLSEHHEQKHLRVIKALILQLLGEQLLQLQCRRWFKAIMTDVIQFQDYYRTSESRMNCISLLTQYVSSTHNHLS